MKFTVYVDDNSHYMDQDERYLLGEYDTEEDAIVAAKKIVDRFFDQPDIQSLSADELFELYTRYGEDPWISPGSSFSAWTYAKQRCNEIGGQ